MEAPSADVDPNDPKAKPFKIEVTGEVGKSDEIQAAIKPADWNEYRVVAKGGHLQQFINGHQTVDVTDETKEGAKSGVLALQLHAGHIYFSNIVSAATTRALPSDVRLNAQVSHENIWYNSANRGLPGLRDEGIYASNPLILNGGTTAQSRDARRHGESERCVASYFGWIIFTAPAPWNAFKEIQNVMLFYCIIAMALPELKRTMHRGAVDSHWKFSPGESDHPHAGGENAD